MRRMSEIFRGGCYCGDVRFEVSEILDAGYCHCSICRRFASAPTVLWANAPASKFRVVRGKPSGFASSPSFVRYFCPRCGTALFGASPSNEGSVSFSICILDEPVAVHPTAHIWCSSQLPYFQIADDLPRFEEGTLTHPRTRRSWRAV